MVLSANFYKIQQRTTSLVYHSCDHKLEKDKIKYREHLVKVLYWFKKLFGTPTFVQFNVLYSLERELAIACNQSRVMFSALHKECIWSPGNIPYLIDLYKQAMVSYNGHAIAVYNSTYKDIFVKSNLVDTNKIHVVGCARLDESHRARTKLKSSLSKTVLFYLIEPAAGPLVYKSKNGDWIYGAITSSDGSLITWKEMSNKVNKAIVGVSKSIP